MKTSLTAFATLLLCGAIATAAEPTAPTATAAPAPAPQVPMTGISPAELLARKDKDADLVILDVRTPAEFAAGHVPRARNVPHDDVAGRLPELASLRDRPVVLYCRSGRRTALAAEQLHKAGFTRLLHLEGDYGAWDAEGRPVERATGPSAPPAN